jgi:hypothetical protein
MGSKKAFALRVGSDILDALEKWAADEFRSTNAQIEWILSKALKEAGRMPRGERKSQDGTNTP